MDKLACLQLLFQAVKSFWDETFTSAKAALRHYGDQSTEFERHLHYVTLATNLFEPVVHAIAKVKQHNANLKTIQARSPVQQTAPPLPSSSHSDLRALYDKTIGCKDTTGHEIILRSLAMQNGETDEVSQARILQYMVSYLQTTSNLLTSIDPAQ